MDECRKRMIEIMAAIPAIPDIQTSADLFGRSHGSLGKDEMIATSIHHRMRGGNSDHGFTLLELIIPTAILLVLSTKALPLARLTIQREKERQLRIDFWEMRDSIDRYKTRPTGAAFGPRWTARNYPPDLDTLVKGEDVNGKKVYFLRRIPIEPITGTTEWGLRSMQDDPESDSWGEQSVFDVLHQN
jgi:general secretion pathway protein G